MGNSSNTDNAATNIRIGRHANAATCVQIGVAAVLWRIYAFGAQYGQ